MSIATKVLKQGVALTDVYRTIQTFMGGYFVNYFNRFGRQWQVVHRGRSGGPRPALKTSVSSMCGTTRGRKRSSLHADNDPAGLGPGVSAAVLTNTVRRKSNGSAAPAYSADQATAALEAVFKETMPREMGFDYSGIFVSGNRKPAEGVPSSAVFGCPCCLFFSFSRRCTKAGRCPSACF